MDMITTRKDHLVLCGQNNTKWAQRGYNHQSEMCERLGVEASDDLCIGHRLYVLIISVFQI